VYRHFALLDRPVGQATGIPGRTGEKKRAPGYAALRVMEQHLAAHDFFAAGTYTLADIGPYACTHVAAEGGFELAAFPNIPAWLDRVASQPACIDMRHVPR
jgi:glutathione S-transferase